MKLYLAVAVLMLAFVAYTEAQDQELTMEERFTQLRGQMEEMGSKFSEKARTFFEGLHNSDFATNARNQVQQYFQTMRDKFSSDKDQ